SVLITYNFDIVHLSEHAGRFLHFAGGNVSTNLMDAVHPALRLELRAALMRAVQGRQSVDVPSLPLEIDGLPRLVDLRVRPLREEERPDSAVDYLMVVFDDRESDQPVDAVRLNTENDAAVRHLEREAGHLKQHLASTIEQYEATTEELKASNEELQAMNEELRSAGEELETSKEELQASNEELITVNQEMKSKVEQLARSNGDLQNLMTATSIATIFLDRELCIQRFTPPAVELFNLIPTDTYRPLSNLRHSLQYDSMIADAQQVIDQLLPVEREVSSEDGRWFLVRVLPYRTLKDRIDGVVFTFVDVTRRHEAEAQLRLSEVRYRSLFTTIEEAFALCAIVLDEAGKPVDYRLLEVNSAFEQVTGISTASAQLKTARELIPGLENSLIETYGRVALTGETARFENYAAETDRWFEVFASPIDERGNGKFALILTNITQRKKHEEELLRLNSRIEQQARVFNTTLTSITDFAYIFNREGRFTYSNQALLNFLGITLDEVVGKNFFDLGYPPELAARHQREIEHILETGETVRAESTFTAPSGGVGVYEYIFSPVLTDDGYVEAVAGSTRDTTQRKRREAQNALLAEFSQSLLLLSSESEIVQLLGEKISDLHDIDMCAFIEVNPAQDEATFLAEWHREGAFQLTGQCKIADRLTDEFLSAMKAGETVVIRDIASDPLVKNAELLAASGIGSLVSVPLIRGGQWEFAIAFYHAAPHPWEDDEVALLIEVAGRIWSKLERVHADEALRESEENLRLAVDAAEMGTWRWDLASDKVYWNERHFLLFGMTPSPNPVHSDDFVNRVHPNDRETVVAKLQTAIAEKSIFRAEFCAVLDTGETRWMSGYGRVVEEAEDGRATHMSGVMMDINERKEAEKRIHEIEARFRLLVDSVHDYAIITVTPDNLIETWNPGATKIFGYEEAEVLGQPGDMLFIPEDREKGEPQKELEIARREGRSADERWHLRQDGSRFYASGVMTALQDDSCQGFVKILHDLTAEKQAEEALQASELRFRTQSDALPQIIWTNEPNGVANHFNKRWFDYSGLSFEASFGLGWQKIVHPTDENNAMLRWQAALEKGEVFETEYRLRNSDGNYRWHIARNVPLRGDNGHILGWFGTATDIQELKDAEEELSQSRDLLEARVEERTQSLQERTIALQKEIVERQRLEDQTRQLMQRIVQVQEEERRRISRELHDNLGQHAAAILLSLQVMQDTDAKRPDGERRQSAAQLARLHQAMNDLMMMTHRLAWELRPAILDNIGLEAALTQYLQEWERPGVAVDFMSRLPESGGFKAEIGLSPDAETALYRVVQECLTNVLRHANASQVGVVLESRPDYVTVIVEDNGRGFDVDAISISKRLGVRGMQERMELVGGTLEVESQPGAGTTIYARVPLDKPKAEIL
ncbi:MAG TPA: PAS domain S-box protein, partial [Abditibacterium sp.]